MFIYQKKLNKEINFILAKKVGMILALLFFGLSLNNVYGTNSFLVNVKEVGNMNFAMGNWIPILTMTVEPAEPDGEDDTYTEAPCVKLFSDIDEVKIYYSFSNEEGEIMGEIAQDTCLYPPEGESGLIAWAVNNENENWVSEKISYDFKVKYAIQKGDVVINELMWMGNFDNPDDEWIELRNMTNREINLSNWDIQYGGIGKNGHIEIPNGYSIKANGYFLITHNKWDETAINLEKELNKNEGYTHVSGMDLKNSGESLILRDKNKNIIDKVWKDESWPDGWDGEFLRMSMERDKDGQDGTLSSSWHTCVSEKCNDERYWREEGMNFGTPGRKNSVESDSAEKEVGNSQEEIASEDIIEKNLPGDDFEIYLLEEGSEGQNNIPLEKENVLVNENDKGNITGEENQ